MPQNFRAEISAGNIGNTRGQIYVLLPAGRKSGKSQLSDMMHTYLPITESFSYKD
jgi:hypothetical protein